MSQEHLSKCFVKTEDTQGLNKQINQIGKFNKDK